ncbi:hypothetical protein BGW36DRAFT_148853 [Talaromyces proteolyticus]|uniref:LysM domain-containing protein n=1 Tax=Talaromyces proteolyticus TaxID=1131652 RepID=A0AAD4KSX9_9EURO|nr:uncharacterized protein BGW36DRAFT_148853 [Talaromyces proteolyticus]KAH8698612.1 hypothetical protein BGW36DRAFT_148853 [Talaromyces proteolyticus]
MGFFAKSLIYFLFVGAATARVINEQEEGIIEPGHVIRNDKGFDIVAAKNPIIAPTSTTSIIKVGRADTVTAGAPSPTQSGLTSNCDAFYFVESGDYCAAIVSKFGNFTLDQFYIWNPAVKSDCSNLLAGYYVCVGISASTPSPIPSPTQTGIASNCNDYYKVQSGDTCVGIANDNKISLSEFYSWNPAVGSSCQVLLTGYYVCVGVSGGKKLSKRKFNGFGLLEREGIPTAMVTVTPTWAAAPSPTQPGIVSGCTEYYKAESGDTCISIVSDHYPIITVSQFEGWNPAVGKDCKTLLVGYYYCVAA